MKPLKRYIRDGLVTYFGSDEPVMLPDAYVEKTREVRGVWFTTVGNSDFPKVTSVRESQAFLDGVVATLKSYHMNAVMFHVRPQNDAFYPSLLAPWSRFLTGTEGKDPGYDVFGYFVKACQKEHIDVHAWMNPYRVTSSLAGQTKDQYLSSLTEENFARKHPSLVIETERGGLILDPSSREVVSYVSSCAYEIAAKYPVKAIHMDDYFYPYDEIKDPLEEKKIASSGLSRGDFRRANVTSLIKAIHDKLSLLPRHVDFGISPFGIYRTNTKFASGATGDEYWERGSANAAGCCTCYGRLSADVVGWMRDKLIDYVVPQDYFDFDNYTKKDDGSTVTVVQYADLARWWAGMAKETGCRLYMGLAFYRYAREGNWSNPEEIMNQLKYDQAYPEIKGAVFFTYNSLVRQDTPASKQAQERLRELWTKDVKGY